MDSIVVKVLIVLLNIIIIEINCREISYKLNPNCGEECDKLKNTTNLVYISSNGEKDMIHFVFGSMSGIPPTLLIVKTIPNTNLLINWTKLIERKDVSNAISFTSDPINSIGLQISRLFFFNDINKTGSYNENYPILEVDWNETFWKSAKDFISSDSNSIKVSFSYDLCNGTINLDLRVYANDGRSDDLPHLAFTQLSSSLEINVNDVQTQNGFHSNDTHRPRLMSHLLLVSEGTRTQQIDKFERITSIDDEYTPGVFDRVLLKLDSNKNETQSKSYIEWKPIAYTDSERVIANTIDVINSNVDPNETISNNSLILLAFFGNRSHSVLTTGFNLTFGASDDTNYYDDKKYNSFSLVVGLDSPPEEKLSLLVQMIILVGFGLPLLVMVISALYLIVRKIRKRNYDDLLLSQESIDQSRIN